jgi:FkbH-like protein
MEGTKNPTSNDELLRLLDQPLNSEWIMRKKKSIRRSLEGRPVLIQKKIAILGGSTTHEVCEILDLFLRKNGIAASFYQSDFGQYEQDILSEEKGLYEFKPDLIYFHTTSKNVSSFPALSENALDVDNKLKAEFERWKNIWEKAKNDLNCVIVQNNFEFPFVRSLGNIDAWDYRGKTNFIQKLNLEFANYISQNPFMHLNDINYLSAQFGLNKWYDAKLWHLSKYALSFDAIPHLAHNLSKIIKSLYGLSKKGFVLDLDNTLWGGVIGDDGVENLKLGPESTEGEAFTEFQSYMREQQERGIVLSVCSKNEMSNAESGFKHPCSILKLDHFTCFVANWDPKNLNISGIAQQLNLGLDSLVFIDDNPAERALVSGQLPDVTVPEVGNDPIDYLKIVDSEGYTEPVRLSSDDLTRAKYYQSDRQREVAKSSFKNYDDFLLSLKMHAEIKPFSPAYLERITQLTNKTNQFNLTTRRYSLAEMEQLMKSSNDITLYGTLSDRFGDNGLITLVSGKIAKPDELHMELWLMSCRVLKRGMELAVFDTLISKAKEHGVKKIIGYYYKTKKNAMVSQFYKDLGFELIDSTSDGNSTWAYQIPETYKKQNLWIAVNGEN